MIAQRSPTADLISSIEAANRRELPGDVARAARDAIFNVAGIAVGASRHPGVDAILATAEAIGGAPLAVVPGRTTGADSHYAALATGFAAHVDDYDDTHLATAIHPGATCLATLVGLAPHMRASGAAALRAFAIGCEVQLRLGLAINPAHYEEGWHITGTVGVAGAATTAGLLLGLEGERLRNALAVAASTVLGHRAAFGTMVKPYHPGKAAANGILSALLASEGFTGPADALEATRGFATVLASYHDLSRLSEGFGEHWELLDNTFKPYPCGLVVHPAIDAAVALGSRIDDASRIGGVRLQCHPLVPELMGKPAPNDPLEARFSARYAVAVGLLDRRAGIAEFSGERLAQSDVRDLCARVELDADEGIARDEARVTVTFADGTTVTEHVLHARGSKDRPLTQIELMKKIEALVEPIIPGGTPRLREAIENLDRAPNVDALLKALVPVSQT